MTDEKDILSSVQEWGRQLKALRDEDKQRVDKLEHRVEEIAKVQTAMQIESKEILALVKNTDGNITNMTSTIFSELKDMKQNLKEANRSHVKKEDIKMLKQIVYGATGIILIAVIGALVNLVVRGGGLM